MGFRAVAVSYTHLDVYKRQIYALIDPVAKNGQDKESVYTVKIIFFYEKFVFFSTNISNYLNRGNPKKNVRFYMS